VATLTEEQKEFIVTRLAMYDSPATILDTFKEHWPGIDAPSRQQIWQYDPERVGSKRISRKLHATFEATRENFLKDVGSIAIAQASFRLRRLQQIHDTHFKNKNYVAAAAVLEQAAKEAGGAFTNQLKVKGNIKHDHEHEHEFKVDEKRATLADLLEQALKATAPAKPATKH
jgi:hypothetical protein